MQSIQDATPLRTSICSCSRYFIRAYIRAHHDRQSESLNSSKFFPIIQPQNVSPHNTSTVKGQNSRTKVFVCPCIEARNLGGIGEPISVSHCQLLLNFQLQGRCFSKLAVLHSKIKFFRPKREKKDIIREVKNKT